MATKLPHQRGGVQPLLGRVLSAEQAVWRAGTYNAIFFGAVSVVFIAFAPAIISIFTHDAESDPSRRSARRSTSPATRGRRRR